MIATFFVLSVSYTFSTTWIIYWIHTFQLFMFLCFPSCFSFIFRGWLDFTFIWFFVFRFFFTVSFIFFRFLFISVSVMFIAKVLVHIFFSWWNMNFFSIRIIFFNWCFIFSDLRSSHTSKIFWVNITSWRLIITM